MTELRESKIQDFLLTANVQDAGSDTMQNMTENTRKYKYTNKHKYMNCLQVLQIKPKGFFSLIVVWEYQIFTVNSSSTVSTFFFLQNFLKEINGRRCNYLGY